MWAWRARPRAAFSISFDELGQTRAIYLPLPEAKRCEDASHSKARRAKAIALDRAMRLAAFLQVALVIVFSAPERCSGFDLRHDSTIEPAALVQFLF